MHYLARWRQSGRRANVHLKIENFNRMKEYQITFQTAEGLSFQNAKARTAGAAIGRALFTMTKALIVVQRVVTWREVGV
jgi:hypothetical protein